MTAIAFYRERSLPFLELKLCTDKSASYKKHFHEEYSLGVIEEGSSTVWCDGRHLDVEAGRLIWIPPYLPHACNPQESSDWRYKMVFFHSDWVHGVIRDAMPARQPFLPDHSTNGLGLGLLNRLAACMTRNLSPLETESSAIALLKAIFPSAAVEGKRSDASVLKPHMIRVKDYLHEHYLEPITLEELERVSGVSKYHLIHSFKKEHNIPPHAYQNMLRINYAKKQLSPERSISDVALEAGFYDQSHFTRLFKHFAGVTPQHYRSSL
ncbi:AraC family transcriptional regulator [Paenibacillus sp. NPDC056579]|uniref:helix-turn-helix transcriptional regulator n=1 Tax=unclassified Paenibacillus TaxID=185978 RepID=UPI001EF77388|nr:AraC family transcriptional regulator [Paenibacillus sp. H1-7]ULL13102.1 AraC family transcriptional regulator [Paenibacillus sp. H1-7]